MAKNKNRINIETNSDGVTEIVIAPIDNPKVKKQLKWWLIAWVILGAMMIGGLVLASTSAELAFILIYLAFWFFFMMKVWRSYRYRTHGKERIVFKEEQLVYIREIGKRGLPRIFPYGDIQSIEQVDVKRDTFISMINNSAWMIAAEGVQIKSTYMTVAVGIQLTKNESEKLVSLIKKLLKVKS